MSDNSNLKLYKNVGEYMLYYPQLAVGCISQLYIASIINKGS